MSAHFPSAEATTSCGSGPEGKVAITTRLTGSTMESVLSLLASTSSALEGVPPPARRTPEARRIPRRRAELTLICMIVNYTLPSAMWHRLRLVHPTQLGLLPLPSAPEAASRTARHGRAGHRRRPEELPAGPVRLIVLLSEEDEASTVWARGPGGGGRIERPPSEIGRAHV